MTPLGGGLDRKERAVERRLRRAVRALRAEANGRTCDGCAHARLAHGLGYCAVNDSVDGDALEIYQADAVACRSWSTRAVAS